MAFHDKDGSLLGKECAKCHNRFPRIGASFGLLGELIFFLLFGGTSKYCPSCRESLKKEGEKIDKDWVFHLGWFGIVVIVVLFIIIVLGMRQVNGMLRA